MESSKLHMAILSGDVNSVSDLLWGGHDPNETCWESNVNTPLLLASSIANIPIIRLLCNHGCDMNTRTTHGETALHMIIASKKNLDDGIKLLLDYGCDANIQENLYGQIPLHALVKHLVAICDYSEPSMCTLKYLLEKSDPSIGDHSKRTALHRAAYAKAHISCIQTPEAETIGLVVKHAKYLYMSLKLRKISKYVNRNWPKYAISSLFECLADLKALLECGANNQNSREENSLHEALEAENGIDVISFLAHFTDLQQKTIYGETPIHIAARKGRCDIVKYLLELGSPINIQDLKGNTPLHLAAERGYRKVVEAICTRQKINLNIQNLDGLTALHVAVESGFLPVVEILLKADSCDVNMKTKQSQTALDLAHETCRRNSQPGISTLLFTEIKKRESDKII